MADYTNVKTVMVSEVPDELKGAAERKRRYDVDYINTGASREVITLCRQDRRAFRNIFLCIENFLKEKKEKKNHKRYIKRQARILNEMIEHGPVRTDKWTEEFVTKWYIWRSMEEIARSTFIREVKTVRAFWKWIVIDKKLLDSSPAKNLVTPPPLPCRGPSKRRISDEEILEASSVLSRRVYSAVVVMYNCGLRATEVERIRPSHIPDIIKNDGSYAYLTVANHKTRKKRLVPIPNETTLLALDYLVSRKKRITPSEVFSILRSPEISFTPIQLRNTAIYRWLEAGENIHTVAAWAGHVTVASTAKFIPKPENLYKPKSHNETTI